uniref:glycosyltransferase WbsX family protein n=1 Tax=Candidatus Planktophila sp. TaxID=2175601 RepID=UPI00404A6566
MKYDIAAYVWPSYTGDEPRTRMFWPDGIGEWQTVKSAKAKFEGHQWPRKPLWGYLNEADSTVMEMHIEEAVKHGVNVFIYDWYWYDGRPFLENCLNDGFLKAKNRNKMKFYLMWANHNVTHLWDKRISDIEDNLIWEAHVPLEEFKTIAKRMIEKYFLLDNYYRIDNEPILMIYDLEVFLKGFPTLEEAISGVQWFQAEAKKSGLQGIHFQMCRWDSRLFKVNYEGREVEITMDQLCKLLGFKSYTHYQFVHFQDMNRDYREIVADVVKDWDAYKNESTLPYFPHVSVGWDNTPRYLSCHLGDPVKGAVVKNNTPENVELAFKAAKKYVDEHPTQPPLITVNSWNEWTETSYLQPDDLYGYGYLEKIQDVFVKD